AGHVRRGRRPARLRGRRRAGHRNRAHPPARRWAVRLRDGPRRRHRHAGAGGGGPAAPGPARPAGPGRGPPGGRGGCASGRGGGAELAGAGADPARATRVRRAHLRYEGTDTALPVPLGTVADMTAGFERAYRQQFSFLMPGKAILVEAVSVEVVVPSADGSRGMRPAAGAAGNRAEIVRMHVNGRWAARPLARRRALRPGEGVDGPALIAEDFATTVVEPGWRARVTPGRDLLLERVAPRPGRGAAGTAVDPVMLEIFNNLFMSVAEQMGARLRATAHSVNIKERLD